MKRDLPHISKKEPITFAMLCKRRPVPFGDVRKYYYLACVGTVALLALCFHISVAAIALRTDACSQISNGIIVVLLTLAVLAMAAHQMRSYLGYGLSACASLAVFAIMQFSNGTGVVFVSDLPEYGEVFRDGIKSTEFWILLIKVIAVIHLIMSIVFIKSTYTVTEEPPLKGMNIKIQQFKDWLDKNNNSRLPGRIASDYWIVSISVVLWMMFVAYDITMGKYDYWSMGLILAGCILVACKQTQNGAFLLVASALIRCTMYQFRFGICIPVVAAYAGLWVALVYLFVETCFLSSKEEKPIQKRWVNRSKDILFWLSVVVFIAIVPIHEFLNAFSGSRMIYQKDNLPLVFFLPLVSIILLKRGTWRDGVFAAISFFWLWDSMKHASPYNDGRLLDFDDLIEHGTIRFTVTSRFEGYVNMIAIAALILAGLLLAYSALNLIFCVMERKTIHEEEKPLE